jgi:hypothetical protein
MVGTETHNLGGGASHNAILAKALRESDPATQVTRAMRPLLAALLAAALLAGALALPEPSKDDAPLCRYDLFGAGAHTPQVPCPSPFQCYLKTQGEERYRDVVVRALHPNATEEQWPAIRAVPLNVTIDDLNWAFARHQMAVNFDCLLELAGTWQARSKLSEDDRSEVALTAYRYIQHLSSLKTMLEKMLYEVNATSPDCYAPVRVLCEVVYARASRLFESVFVSGKPLNETERLMNMERMLVRMRSSILSTVAAVDGLESSAEDLEFSNEVPPTRLCPFREPLPRTPAKAEL